ncbi:MAG: type II toxin-antitoxin system Phd/YefM family antitoxin [Clostridiales bacterium]|jgi:PHD/YefM family antitoxin component YafN of YafNO toxin-antitoxin module|nr:type II toxin-antitoxin system Phd/YefM family antitoxin [Clostridiales bacterium]
MPIVRPISDLRNTNEISQLCHNRQEPIFITENGYSDLVIMSMNVYEKQNALCEVFKKLEEAEELENSGVANVNGKNVFKKLRRKYGQKTV